MTTNTPNDDPMNWLRNETPADWVETNHPQVYFRERYPPFTMVVPRELVIAGAGVAEALPGEWTVVITVGPYRSSDLEYTADCEFKTIHLDFYSARPGFDYIPDLIEEVTQDFREWSNDDSDGSAAPA